MASRGRILIADDEKSFLKFSSTLFARIGYVCDCAENGTEAVCLLRKHRYDVVISDIKMPGNDDLLLAREVERIQDGVPVVIVTGYPSQDTAIRAVKLPVVDYIEKPVEFRELLSSVRSAIMAGRKRRRASGAGVCPTDGCGELRDLVQEIDGAVKTLECTKRQFKSRTVGRVRNQLQAAAKRHKRGKNQNRET
jgi:DNA-binding NtrC family response regulator